MEIFHLIYTAGAEAFLGVGVFVAISLLIIGIIDYKFNGIIIRTLEKNKKNQIYLAAFLGLTPGCGGAILVVPMYALGRVSFGALVTAFITTMGDAAFVLMVGDMKAYIYILVISGVVGIVSGLIIDKFEIGKDLVKNREKVKEQLGDDILVEEKLHAGHRHIGHDKGDIVDQVLHSKNTNRFVYKLTHKWWYKIFWTFTIICLPLAYEHMFHGHGANGEHIHGHGHEIFEIFGFLGFISCIIYTFLSRKIVKSSDFDKVENKLNSLKETMIHSAEEVAFLVSWVFVAFFLYQLLLIGIGGTDSLKAFISQSGFIVVIIATLIGLIPGCGPQILLAALYIQGVIPFSALMANAICNDGDALFPLIALNKKSALMVTIYNVIPSLIVGGVLYFLENM
ncbi:putative manganese transporter [uncultured Cetobacterium sp.]|uniref:putative manganese transporter n=1 Tax=uncultured Cetobacterium sp. TaxID=527638 RepID=UPI002613E45E|nr:putative manganese transporter [uncultured Cetobacterium sp.]